MELPRITNAERKTSMTKNSPVPKPDIVITSGPGFSTTRGIKDLSYLTHGKKQLRRVKIPPAIVIKMAFCFIVGSSYN